MGGVVGLAVHGRLRAGRRAGCGSGKAAILARSGNRCHCALRACVRRRGASASAGGWQESRMIRCGRDAGRGQRRRARPAAAASPRPCGRCRGCGGARVVSDGHRREASGLSSKPTTDSSPRDADAGAHARPCRRRPPFRRCRRRSRSGAACRRSSFSAAGHAGLEGVAGFDDARLRQLDAARVASASTKPPVRSIAER